MTIPFAGALLSVERHDEIAKAVSNVAYRINRDLGPGMMEKIYNRIMFREIGLTGLRVRREVEVGCVYNGWDYGVVCKLDLIVEDAVILELKANENLPPTCKKQLLTYLRLTGCRLGLVINFAPMMVVKRVVNGL